MVVEALLEQRTLENSGATPLCFFLPDTDTTRSDGSLFLPRFRLDISLGGPASLHLREGHALTLAALTMSLLRGLAPLLTMLDSNAKWPLTADGYSGWLYVTESTGMGARVAAERAAATLLPGGYSMSAHGANDPHFASTSATAPPARRVSYDGGAPLRSWGGCWRTIGSGMLQYASVDGERRAIYLDSWEVRESAPAGAILLYTHSSASDGNMPRAVTLHCESRHEAARWAEAIKAMQRSHRMGGTLGQTREHPPRWRAGKVEATGPPFPSREALVNGRWRAIGEKEGVDAKLGAG